MLARCAGWYTSGNGERTGWPSGPCIRSVTMTAYSVFSSRGRSGRRMSVSVSRSYQGMRSSIPAMPPGGKMPSVSGWSRTPSKSVSSDGR